MKLYNSLSKQLEEFQAARSGEAGLYTCGPTLYDRQHIGNLRTFMLADTLRRVLEASGFRVKSVINVTDVEDKIIAKLGEQSLEDFTEGFFAALKEDMAALGMGDPTWIRATDRRSIQKMGELIGKIMERGYAYARDGSIYLSIERYTADFPYGVFQKIDPAKLQATGRVDADEYDKESPQDFALWKAKKPGEPSWAIKVGDTEFEGRPGWHIECSAMTELELGEEFDIHLGGTDLQFPHHENEVAQSRAAHGKLLARYWLHGEMLFVEGQKMSKSLGNLVTLDEIRERGFDPLDLRYLYLQAHYRSKQNFTWEALRGAQAARAKLVGLAQTQDGGEESEAEEFRRILGDDLATPAALAYLWERLGDGGNHRPLVEEVEKLFALGLLDGGSNEVPDDVSRLVEAREQARAERDFAESDRLRGEIRGAGYHVEDTPEGPRVSRARQS
jgi:cysteinyl-tRNA synthetase